MLLYSLEAISVVIFVDSNYIKLSWESTGLAENNKSNIREEIDLHKHINTLLRLTKANSIDATTAAAMKSQYSMVSSAINRAQLLYDIAK